MHGSREEKDAIENNNADGNADEKIVVLYSMATGNKIVDQFQSWYFGGAFAFLFKCCTRTPDMLDFAEQRRFRRTEAAPRIKPPFESDVA